jgi:hypothetical protein
MSERSGCSVLRAGACPDGLASEVFSGGGLGCRDACYDNKRDQALTAQVPVCARRPQAKIESSGGAGAGLPNIPRTFVMT